MGILYLDFWNWTLIKKNTKIISFLKSKVYAGFKLSLTKRTDEEDRRSLKVYKIKYKYGFI